MIDQTPLLKRVRELIQPLLVSRGVELVDLVCHPAGGQEHWGEVLGAGEELVTFRMDSGEKLQVPLSQIVRAVQDVSL